MSSGLLLFSDDFAAALALGADHLADDPVDKLAVTGGEAGNGVNGGPADLTPEAPRRLAPLSLSHSKTVAFQCWGSTPAYKVLAGSACWIQVRRFRRRHHLVAVARQCHPNFPRRVKSTPGRRLRTVAT